MEEKILGKLTVVMLRCVFWNAPTVYYNNVTRSEGKKIVYIGTRARDSMVMFAATERAAAAPNKKLYREKLQNKFKRQI